MATILVGVGGEDERRLLADLSRESPAAGFTVVFAEQGGEIIDHVRQDAPDLVVLGDGLVEPGSRDICRTLREESAVPIILISASQTEFDRILGLELGADEYLVKPVTARELLAHVRAIFRRTRLVEQRLGEDRGDVLRVGNLSVDLRQHQVYLAGQPIALKPREFNLAFFVGHAGQVYTRAELIQAVWGRAVPGGTRTVDIHVRCLREKIEEDPSNPARLQTVRGVGYRFVGWRPGKLPIVGQPDSRQSSLPPPALSVGERGLPSGRSNATDRARREGKTSAEDPGGRRRADARRDDPLQPAERGL